MDGDADEAVFVRAAEFELVVEDADGVPRVLAVAADAALRFEGRMQHLVPDERRARFLDDRVLESTVWTQGSPRLQRSAHTAAACLGFERSQRTIAHHGGSCA